MALRGRTGKKRSILRRWQSILIFLIVSVAVSYGPVRNEVISTEAFEYSTVPEYSGDIFVEVNGNTPFFTNEELEGAKESYESYAELDFLGRCGVCIASIGKDIMPTEERGKIGDIRPTGWKQNKYAGLVEGNYLYNRSHLIGYQLTGENANPRNLITGTRYFNKEGMLPFENLVADYVRENNAHVLYRVTPVYEGVNLLASGVLMEAKSVEDNGEGLEYCVFVYNIQPGITIYYGDGSNESATELKISNSKNSCIIPYNEL